LGKEVIYMSIQLTKQNQKDGYRLNREQIEWIIKQIKKAQPTEELRTLLIRLSQQYGALMFCDIRQKVSRRMMVLVNKLHVYNSNILVEAYISKWGEEPVETLREGQMEATRKVKELIGRQTESGE
jgi:hypothetical protein